MKTCSGVCSSSPHVYWGVVRFPILCRYWPNAPWPVTAWAKKKLGLSTSSMCLFVILGTSLFVLFLVYWADFVIFQFIAYLHGFDFCVNFCFDFYFVFFRLKTCTFALIRDIFCIICFLVFHLFCQLTRTTVWVTRRAITQKQSLILVSRPNP